MNSIYLILRRAYVTEKTTNAQAYFKYTFIVDPHATKIDIKNAVQTMYQVKVTDVNKIPIRKKERSYKRTHMITKRRAGIKAIVTLKKGEKIDVMKMKEGKSKASSTAKK